MNLNLSYRSETGQIGKVLNPVTLTFDVRPSKTIGHLTHVPRSFTYRFIAICELKLELSSGNGKIGKVLPPVTLTFDVRPSKTIGHLTHAPWRYSYSFVSRCELKLELSSGNGQIGAKLARFWPMWPLTYDLHLWCGQRSYLWQCFLKVLRISNNRNGEWITGWQAKIQ